MKLSTLGLRIALVVIGLNCETTVRSAAQTTRSSFSDSEIEKSELSVTLQKTLEENAKLKEALAEAYSSLAENRKLLAAATAETEVFRRQTLDLKLRIEALGLETAGGNTLKLEQRLLTAVSDLKFYADEKRNLSEALIRLSEAASFYAKSVAGGDPEPRAVLEAEIRRANSMIGASNRESPEAPAVSQTLNDGLTISVKGDLSLVVMNLGEKHGVRVGMPFQVTRQNRIIGQIQVVEVRETFSGAIIQSLSSEKDPIQAGDHLKVLAQQ